MREYRGALGLSIVMDSHCSSPTRAASVCSAIRARCGGEEKRADKKATRVACACIVRGAGGRGGRGAHGVG